MTNSSNWNKTEPDKPDIGWFKSWFTGGWFGERDIWSETTKNSSNWNETEKE
ncbi:MAG: hypothetical protein U9N03_03685 [Candidatus Caldatribacteriota bacterium]|nr:hypothetical protein [Candidatus Caldatribacteriota bacterium]